MSALPAEAMTTSSTAVRSRPEPKYLSPQPSSIGQDGNEPARLHDMRSLRGARKYSDGGGRLPRRRRCTDQGRRHRIREPQGLRVERTALWDAAADALRHQTDAARALGASQQQYRL